MTGKQTAPLIPKTVPVLLLVAGLALVRAEADVVTAAGGESLQGTVTFREGDALEMASESGEKVRISLADLASVDLTSGDQQWLIGGTGVLTANGSFLAWPVVKMDKKVVESETGLTGKFWSMITVNVSFPTGWQFEPEWQLPSRSCS